MSQRGHFCLREGIEDCPVREVPKMQSTICKFVGLRFSPFSCFGTIKYRFKLRGWCDDEELNSMTSRAVSFCEDIVGHVPPCVLFAVINTFSNGWTTEARFQKSVSDCLLCYECSGVDSLDHYASCIVAWRIFSTLFTESVFLVRLVDSLGCRLIL